jgi:phosphatidylglycerophosphate synthase
MSKRISYSLLDPVLTAPMKGLYNGLFIPRWFPPEGIVVIGHLFAITAAIGFAFSTGYWWGGLLIALGVAGNHISDCLDGTHARATSQCRNGGELLDHFFDPLSFAYWITGMAFSCGRLDLGIAGVICMYATAVLTNIKAKMIGEFTLARFGPTEFKTLLLSYGLAISLIAGGVFPRLNAVQIAFWCFTALLIVGIVQLLVNLVCAIRDVNRSGSAPDTTEWELTAASQASTDEIDSSAGKA